MGSRPKVQKTDPEAEAQAAKDKATAEANREAALKRGGARTALASTQQTTDASQSGVYGALTQNQQPSSLYSAAKKQLGG